MTNRHMVQDAAGAPAQTPNVAPLPPMPAPEDAARPTTTEDPIDSPQVNPAAGRGPSAPGEHGLATER